VYILGISAFYHDSAACLLSDGKDRSCGPGGTFHAEKAVASPGAAAKHIIKASLRGKDQAYLPRFWWPVMLLIRLIPGKLFKRMRL
jgi:hypothetical protein